MNLELDVAQTDLPDDVMANPLEAPGADETILTRWSNCALTDSPGATLGRGAPGDMPAPDINARVVLRLGDAQSADYLVTGRLGEGGMEIVFEAEQVYFGRRVALKMIKPALSASDLMAVKAFFREAVITSRQEHPGVIPVLDFGVSQDGRALYAMIRASGVPWRRVIRDKTLSENLAVFDRITQWLGRRT
jgi:serine/threonine protein kinase